MVFTNAPLGILHFDQKGKVLDCNERFAEIMGAPREKFLDFNVLEGIKDQQMLKGVQDSLEGKIGRYEGVYVSVTGGKAAHLRVMGGRILSDDGNLLGGLGIFEDISERKQAEEVLRESEERYRNFFQTSRDCVFITTLDGKLTDFNDSGVEMLGYDPGDKENLLGTNVSHFYCNLEEVKRLSRAVLKKGFCKDYPVDLKKKDGTIINTVFTTTSRKDGQGNVIGFFGTIKDITEHKRAQQEKEALQAQLLQSQKMETVGTLAAGIAHDFNNMLQVILGYSDMLLSGKNKGEPGYEELQTIIKTTHAARDLVQKIRIFSRKADVKLVPLVLNRRVDDVSKILARTLPKTIDIDIRLADNLAIIKADSTLMDQMVINLALNAGEAMPEGGRLTIETRNIVLDDDFCMLHAGLMPGPHVVLTVADTGRGMSEELIEKVFDPFFSTKQRDYRRGTGLGLSVVHGIVEQHKGCITTESEVNKGTIFRIYFPAVEAEEVPEVVQEIPVPTGGNETVLLAEDEEMVRDLGVMILEKFGYTVFSACNGQEAIEVYQKERGNISLVILDILMPRMDGKECLQELLKINPSVKVLISSGVAQDDLIQDVVELGARGALRKPYNMRGLLDAVRELLDSD